MLAQIWERQVHEPTEHQDACDLRWNKSGEELNRWAYQRHSEDAKARPLAHYEGIPWPTVPIGNTTYIFDQWANGEYAWANNDLSNVLEALFRQVHHDPIEDQSISRDDGRLCNLTYWNYVLNADLQRPENIRFCPGGIPRTGPMANLLGPCCPTVEPDTFVSRYCRTKRRVFLIDSGASNNTLKDRDACSTLQNWLVGLPDTVTFKTANKSVKTHQGVKVKVAEWDMPAEYLLVGQSAELISLGERCMHGGFIFLWNGPKHPCFISPGG